MATFVSNFLPIGDRFSDRDYIDSAIQTVLYFPKLAVFAETTTIYCASYNSGDSHGPIGLRNMNESVSNGVLLSVSKRSPSSFLCLSAIVKDNDPDGLAVLDSLKNKINLKHDDDMNGSLNSYTLEYFLLHEKMYTAYTVYMVNDTECELKYTIPTSSPLISATAIEGTPFIAATSILRNGYTFTFDCLLDIEYGGKLIPTRTVKQKSGDITYLVDTALYPAINVMFDRPANACTNPATTVKKFVDQVCSRSTRSTSDILYKLSAVHLDVNTKVVYYREYDLKSTNLRVAYKPGIKKQDSKHKTADTIDYNATIESFKPIIQCTRTLIVTSTSSIIRISALVMPYTQNSLLNDKYAIITEHGDLQIYSRKEQTDKPSATIKVFTKKPKRAFIVPLRDGVIALVSSAGESVLIGVDGKWNSDKHTEEMRGQLCKIFIDEFLAANLTRDQQDLRDKLSTSLLPPVDSYTKPSSLKKQTDKLAIITTFTYNSTVTCASVAPDYRIVCLGLTSQRFVLVPAEPIKNRALLLSYRAKLGRELSVNLHTQYLKYDIETAMGDTVKYLSEQGLDGQRLMEKVNFFFAFSKDAEHSDFLPVQESTLDVINHHQDAPLDTIEMLSVLASVTKDDPLGKSSIVAFDPDIGKSMMNDIKELMRSTMRTVAVPGVGSTALPGEGKSQILDYNAIEESPPEYLEARSKRVDFVEPILSLQAGIEQVHAEQLITEKHNLATLSTIDTRGLTELDGSHITAPIHSASGLYQTGQNQLLEVSKYANIDILIEENFKNHLVDVTRNLLESGFDCHKIFNAAEEDKKIAMASIMNVSDLNENPKINHLTDPLLAPQHTNINVVQDEEAGFDAYPLEQENVVPMSFVSTVWLRNIVNSMAVMDAEARLPVQLPTFSNLNGAKLLVTHYKDIRGKSHTLKQNHFVLALELLLADDPLFITATCSTKTLSNTKNSYYLADYARREHEELSQCSYSSIFTVRCNLFQLSVNGETIHSTSERLLCEILDNPYDAKQDHAIHIVAGIEAFLARVYQEDLSAMLTAPGQESLISMQYTQLPERLITFISDGQLANNLSFTQDFTLSNGSPCRTNYELIGTISQDCTVVYKLDTVGRWCMLEGSDPQGLTVSIRPNDVANNSFYTIYKRTNTSDIISMPLDSLDNVMMLADSSEYNQHQTVDMLEPNSNMLSSSYLKGEVLALKSKLEYQMRREERATEKIDNMIAENYELKKQVESLKVDLQFQEILTKSELLRQQNVAEDAEQDSRLDEILHLQLELKKREGEEKILVLELEEARRRIADLIYDQETTDMTEYDVVLKHCFTVLGGDEASIPNNRKELLLMLQKQCITVSTEYDLVNFHRKGSMRLSYGPARASQLRMSKSRADARSIAQSIEAFRVSDFQDHELGNRKIMATTLLPVVCFFIGIAIIVIFAIAFNRNDAV